MRMRFPIYLSLLVVLSGLSVSCDSEASGGSAGDGDEASAGDGDGAAGDGDGASGDGDGASGDGDGASGDGDGDAAGDGDGDAAGDGDSAGDGDGDAVGDGDAGDGGDGDSAGDGDGDGDGDGAGDDDGGMAQVDGGDGDGTGGRDAGTDGGTDAGAGGDGDGGDGFNGCFVMDAVDMRGMPSVTITDLDAWTLSHAGCLRVSVGTVVTWHGNFQFHPISGGLTPTPDPSSPITLAGPGSGTDPVVVHFAEPGGYPYFCTVHNQAMQGTVYVQ